MKYKLRTDRVFLVVLILIAAIMLCRCVKSSHSSGESKSAKVQKIVTSETTTALVTLNPIMTTTSVTTFAKVDSPTCEAAALYCVEDKQILYSDNINKRVSPASLTKLLTASTALKYVRSNDICTVGSEQSMVQPYSSLCGLELYDTLSMHDLITGLLMSSGNDAAYAIAASTAYSLNNSDMTDYEAVDYFVDLMNKTAADIGMTESHFTTPDGWDDSGQYVTAADLIKLAEYALSVNEIKKIVGTAQTTAYTSEGKAFNWTNSNLFLDVNSEYYSSNVFGMKTGTTLYAGYSLITAFESHGKTYISVVAGCQSDEGRYELSQKLMDYVK